MLLGLDGGGYVIDEGFERVSGLVVRVEGLLVGEEAWTGYRPT